MKETALAYAQRIIAKIEDREPLTVLAATADALQRLIDGVPDSIMRNRPTVAQWSPTEIIAHLCDAEIVTAFRIRFILGAPGSAIAGYDQDAWVITGHYATRDPRKSVEHFRAVREANLVLLASLTPEQWKQYGIHSERGPETIEHIVRMTAGHDINHLQQIHRIVAK